MVDISILIWFINQLKTGGAPPCTNSPMDFLMLFRSGSQKSTKSSTAGRRRADFMGRFHGIFILWVHSDYQKGDSTTKWGPYSQPVQPCDLSFGFLEPLKIQRAVFVRVILAALLTSLLGVHAKSR